MEQYYQEIDPLCTGEQLNENQVVKLNTNENPFPPSPKVIQGIQRCLGSELKKYPDPESKELRDGIADFYEIEMDNVFVGKAWSLTTILKEINQALNENRSEFYAIPQNRDLVAQEFLLFENSGSDDLESTGRNARSRTGCRPVRHILQRLRVLSENRATCRRSPALHEGRPG